MSARGKFFGSLVLLTILNSVHLEATCARCALIEKKRAEEQAKTGPQKTEYYDDTHKGEISLVTDGDSYRMSQEGALNEENESEEAVNNGRTKKLPKRIEEKEKADVREDESQKSGAIYHSEFTNSSVKSLYENGLPTSLALVILQTRNLVNTLGGSFTFFAPTNESLEGLGRGYLFSLLKPENAQKLEILVGNHFVAKKITDLSQSSLLTTINGLSLNVAISGNVTTVNGVKVLGSQPLGENGIVYILDGVILP